MTTSQRMDAIEMAQHRRRPLPETAQTAAYLDMMQQVHRFQDALVAANPEEDQAKRIGAKLAELTELLEAQAVAEHERFYARGEVGGSLNQALLPPLMVDEMTDDRLHGYCVPGLFAMGLNQAMHGGIIAALFDVSMGRLAAGLEQRICRTAYLNTQYRNIAPIGQRLDVRVWTESVEGRKRFLRAELFHGATLCAEADALFVEVRAGHQ